MKDFILNHLYTKKGHLNPNAAQYKWWEKNGFERQYNELMEYTSFLSDTALLSERVYCVLNDVDKPILCDECEEEPVKWQKQIKQYARFCGLKCKSANKSVREKTRKTNIKKYGSENPFGSEQIQSKIRKTNLEKYGDTSPARTATIRQKIKQTKESEDKEAIKQKREKTMMSRFGVNNIFASDEYKKFIKEKGNYNQYPFSEETEKKLNDYKWLYENYITLGKNSYMIGELLSVTPTTVLKALRRYNIPITYTYNSSQAEVAIGNEIESWYDGDVVYSDRSIIAPFELDVVIPNKKVAIEYCGVYWHSDKIHEDWLYHKKKLERTNTQGYRLITIFEDEWIYNPNRVISLIKNVLNCDDSKRVYARTCTIKEVNSQDFSEFLYKNHLQGAQNCSVRLGLYYDSTLVAVLGFRRLDELIYDLNRFATSCKVIGGFSKLLSHFKKHYDWDKITTFADRRYSEGNLYLKSGFIHQYNTQPNYFYVKGDKKYSRNRFMKHKLSKVLEHFDPNLTEKQNMEKNGYSRIYDCGHMKFELNNPNPTRN